MVTQLLDQLATVDPFRFEQIVLDLLVAMGYGGSRKEAAETILLAVFAHFTLFSGGFLWKHRPDLAGVGAPDEVLLEPVMNLK